MKNITAVYFSPTGGTKKACMALASAMSQDVKEVDLCTSDWEWTFGPGDVVIVGMPVFGGRIPGFAAEKLKHCRGNGAVAVTAAVYGNRAFDSCTACGRCAKLCPAGAIPLDAPGTTKADQCILCMRCVSVCPTRARSLPAPALLMLEQKLSPVRDIRRENELFL